MFFSNNIFPLVLARRLLTCSLLNHTTPFASYVDLSSDLLCINENNLFCPFSRPTRGDIVPHDEGDRYKDGWFLENIIIHWNIQIGKQKAYVSIKWQTPTVLVTTCSDHAAEKQVGIVKRASSQGIGDLSNIKLIDDINQLVAGKKDMRDEIVKNPMHTFERCSGYFFSGEYMPSKKLDVFLSGIKVVRRNFTLMSKGKATSGNVKNPN
ncbi:unnamed protein product [Linum trigynum]|uniref:Uncharacterized protein n=1 Tax=Linum trigynum TaxID=586398 RepID=A0AAV2E6D4_9ROSI